MTTEKSPDAYRTISEVANSLELPQHVLRFWETKFSQIKPLKRGGGRRYYRPEDVDLLKGIRHLLYEEGYTIKGVQKIIKEQGRTGVVATYNMKSQSAAETEILNQTGNSDNSPEVETSSETTDANELSESKEGVNADSDSPNTESVNLPKDVIVENASDPLPNKAVSTLISKLGIDRKTQATEQKEVETLSKKDLKSLNDTLYELLECKRILDNVR